MHTKKAVDEYEYCHPKRHDGTEMVLTRTEQEQILMELGYSEKELIMAVRSNVKLEKKRRQTVNNLPILTVEEIWEGASKKVGRMMRKRPGSKYLYRQWVNKCEAQEEDREYGAFEEGRGRQRGGGGGRAGMGVGANFNIVAHEESSRSGTSTSTGLRSALKKSCSRSSITCTNTFTNRNATTDGCSDFVSTSYLSHQEESQRGGEDLSSDYSLAATSTGRIMSRSTSAAHSGCVGDIANNNNEVEGKEVGSEIVGSYCEGEGEHSKFSTLNVNTGELVSPLPSDNAGGRIASDRGVCRGSSAGVVDIKIIPPKLKLDQGQ